MIFAVISDVHSNQEALDAVIADAQSLGCEYGFCLGDIVGYGPDPKYCIQKVKEFCRVSVLGNHDLTLLGYENADQFTSNSQIAIHLNRQEVDEDDLEYLRSLNYIHRERDYFFTHSSPKSPADWSYLYRPPEFIAAFEYFEERMAFFGHTHLPVLVKQTKDTFVLSDQLEVILEAGERCLVNPGSVGQPRDENPLASYCIVNTFVNSVQFRRVEYDISKTQQKMKDKGFPEQLWKRLELGV